MTWVRLADDFADHPKLAEAGPLAGWLWVCGLAYANKHLTDGYLPTAAVRRLADVEDPFRLAARLVASGLWEPADGGYRIHDFGEYQPSAESVRAERERNAKRAAEWRERQKSSGSTGAHTGAHAGGRNGVSADAPVPAGLPGTVQVPAGTTPPLPPSPQAERGERSDAGGAGTTNQRRRRSRAGGEASTTPPAPPEVLSGPTDADRAVWETARLLAKRDLNAANAELLDRLDVAGRGADGGLRLRAPPGQGLGRFRGLVARALCDAGDAAGAAALIV